MLLLPPEVCGSVRELLQLLLLSGTRDPPKGSILPLDDERACLARQPLAHARCELRTSLSCALVHSACAA